MIVYVIRVFVEMRKELAANAAILKRLAERCRTFTTATFLKGGRKLTPKRPGRG